MTVKPVSPVPFDARPLEDRLAAAFTDGATSDTVAALIQETEETARAASEAAEQARRRALEPATAAAFQHERLQAAVSRLRERHTQLQAAEEDDRRRTAYEEARAERDELAAELARVYPPLADQLADLLERLRESDARIEHINAHARPPVPSAFWSLRQWRADWRASW
jgi:hypothetical protein